MRFLHQYQNDAIGQFQCRLHGIGQPHANGILDYQPVNDRGYIVLFILVQIRNTADIIDGPINTHANKAFPLYAGENIFVLAFLAANKRGANLEFRTLGPRENRIDYLRRMLACNLLAAYPAVRLAYTGKKKSEIIVNFSGSRHRRTGIAAGASLLNCDSWGQTGNIGNRWFLHLFEKLTGVGAERLDIFPPAFGVNRIERERAFAGAADAGDYHQLIAGNIQVNIF